MYKTNKPQETSINVNESYVGETIEQKVRRIMNNKEPISDGSPLIYTERKEGVKPEYNIRTDRFEIAIEAMDKVTKSHQAKRENKAEIGKKAVEGMKKEDSGAKPIQTTDNQ